MVHIGAPAPRVLTSQCNAMMSLLGLKRVASQWICGLPFLLLIHGRPPSMAVGGLAQLGRSFLVCFHLLPSCDSSEGGAMHRGQASESSAEHGSLLSWTENENRLGTAGSRRLTSELSHCPCTCTALHCWWWGHATAIAHHPVTPGNPFSHPGHLRYAPAGDCAVSYDSGGQQHLYGNEKLIAFIRKVPLLSGRVSSLHSEGTSFNF